MLDEQSIHLLRCLKNYYANEGTYPSYDSIGPSLEVAVACSEAVCKNKSIELVFSISDYERAEYVIKGLDKLLERISFICEGEGINQYRKSFSLALACIRQIRDEHQNNE